MKKRNGQQPYFRQQLTFGQKAADALTGFLGSWRFLILFTIYLMIWIGMNSWLLTRQHFDPYPFILLNLTLSCLAAVQAPVILMAQNRQEERDRLYARYDYQVNRKAEREIQQLQKEVTRLQGMLKRK